ncbi:MAG TPA: SRPBCC family protein, partial [Microthrixaceae bacterium]|nr:SRPBCC family protein [Microthrixaceae bacterium]
MASIVETLDIDRPVAHTYAVWADVERWPEFLHHVERVERTGDRTFHWWLKVAGAEKAFEAELTELVPDQRI